MKTLLTRRIPLYSHFQALRHPLPFPRTRKALRSKKRRKRW